MRKIQRLVATTVIIMMVAVLVIGALSSITSFERQGDSFVEVDYRDPSSKLGAIDRGAV